MRGQLGWMLIAFSAVFFLPPAEAQNACSYSIKDVKFPQTMTENTEFRVDVTVAANCPFPPPNYAGTFVSIRNLATYDCTRFGSGRSGCSTPNSIDFTSGTMTFSGQIPWDHGFLAGSHTFDILVVNDLVFSPDEVMARHSLEKTIGVPDTTPAPTPTPPIPTPQQGQQPSGTPALPEGKAPNLIVLVHGCCTDNLSDWNALADEIEKIINPREWEVVVWDWRKDEKTGNDQTPVPPIWDYDNFKDYADIAYTYADIEAQELADAIGKHPRYEYIHLVAHSTGAKLIDKAAKWLALDKERKNKERPFIHLTFLDAYTPDEDRSDYGNLANYPHYAEHYVHRGLRYTDTCLSYAFNVDLGYVIVRGGGGFGGHQTPRKWYKESITNQYLKHGYSLSLEGGNNEYKELIRRYPEHKQCRLFGIQCIPSDCW